MRARAAARRKGPPPTRYRHFFLWLINLFSYVCLSAFSVSASAVMYDSFTVYLFP